MNIEDKIEDLSYITGIINGMARSDNLDLYYTEHCLQRMKEREITSSDILFVLKTGIVTKYQGKAKHSNNTHKIHKYLIEGQHLTKNRDIGLVVLIEIDRLKMPAIKLQEIVTTMWRD